jgi:hypothetical protein
MERTGERTTRIALPASRAARGLGAGLLLLGGVLALAGCYVVPAQPAYVAPGPIIVAPAPVYRWHGHGWHGHRHGHGWYGHRGHGHGGSWR